MSHMGGSGRRRGRAVAAVLLALCIAAPELGGVAAAATSSTSSAGSSVSEPTNVVLVARRRSRSQVERARFRAYLRRHPKVLERQAKRSPGTFRRRVIRRVRLASGKRVQKAAPARKRRARAGGKARARKARRAYAGAKARRKKNANAKKKQRRRRGAAVAGTAAARKKRAQNNRANAGADSLGWSDWLAIGLLALAPFAAVALLLYITDLRRRPRAPSRSKRRRSLVITPHKS
jgi:hypothetical protein